MVTGKRKKNSRMRGSHTHGWGSKKKRRGSGSRGGKGMAGSGKRGDAKKPSINPGTYFGKHGFVKKNANIIKAINIRDIEIGIDKLLRKNLIDAKSGFYEINLTENGYDKLLANGNVTQKMKIIVKYASPNAIEKIKNIGGEVVLPAKEEKEVKKEVAETPKVVEVQKEENKEEA